MHVLSHAEIRTTPAVRSAHPRRASSPSSPSATRWFASRDAALVTFSRFAIIMLLLVQWCVGLFHFACRPVDYVLVMLIEHGLTVIARCGVVVLFALDTNQLASD